MSASEHERSDVSVPDAIVLDLERRARIGIEEAVLCAGKTPGQVAEIMRRADEAGRSLLLTRLDTAPRDALPGDLVARLDYEPLSRTGFFGAVAAPAGAPRVAIVSAGTSDQPVSREAARTLAYHGHRSAEIGDVGVAGLWRLLARIEEIRAFPIVIVAAGMDAALPSVVGGLVPGVVIAVPTSTGYGVAGGGSAALAAMLASCAPGVAAVNIDNGYGAACVALRALGQIAPPAG